MPAVAIPADNPPGPEVEQAVLAVLSGSPLDAAADRIGVSAVDLADAVASYQAAGRAALATRVAFGAWYQIHVQFLDWQTAEHTAVAHLWPLLRAAETDTLVSAWWYLRKAPCWRLRFRAGDAGPAAMQQYLAGVLDDLTRRGLLARWWPSLYEPETLAFGGPLGIATAHRLFHADSRSILNRLSQPTPDPAATLGRREISVLLCAVLMRAAALDWHEQGDVWHRVTLMRPPPADVTGRIDAVRGQIQALLSLDTGPRSPASDSAALASARGWLAAFTTAGQALGAAAHEGTLQRGLRDVLAHHVIFHWNRLGLSTTTQAVLAQAAVAATLNPAPAHPEIGTDAATL